MAGSTMNLSLLARGIGTVVQNGHEKIDVKLEPEDYYNFMENQHRVYLPPLEPKYAFVDEGNTPKGSLPKTFITRKGALLLFSEDYATRREHGDGAATERSHRNKTDHNYSLDDLNLKTVDDLGKSILAYGSQVQDGVNLRFIKPPINTPRRVRPGFSARRYLSRLTRSFDDTFLDKLLKNGYVHEKTLFVNNALVPSLKRRINDDLSYMPAPYRIMKQMLMAPGILSGYTFYKGDTNMHDLDPLDEEDEAEVMSEPIEQKGGDAGLTPMAIGIMDSNERIVSYSDLGDDEKEHVLADLLVKSAITHALDVQREKVLSSGAGSEAGSSHHSSHHSGSVVGGSGGRGSGAGAAGDLGLNMEDAIRSFLESQATRSQQSSAKPHIDDKDLPLVSATPRSHNSLRGRKLSWHSGKSFDSIYKKVHGTPHPPSSQKEYVGGAAVVSLRDNSMASVHSKPGQAESRSSSQSPTRTVSQAASQQPHPPATPPTSHAQPPSEATSRVASQPPSQAASHAPDQTGGVYSAAASQAGSKAGSHAGSRRSSARESLHQQQEEEGFPAEGIPSPADIASARDATFNPTPVLPPIAHGTASSTPRSLGLGISASDNEADDTPRSDKAPSEKAGGSRRSSQRGAQSHRSSIAGGNASRDQSPRSVISQSQFTLDLDALPKGDFAAVLGGGPSHPASVAGSGAGDTASVTSHSSMRGKALRATGSTPRSKQSNRSDGEEDGPKAGGGSVIYAPDGSLISVGGSVAPKEPVPPAAPVEDDMTAAEATQLPAEDGAEAEEAGADDDVLAEQQPVSARSSARSHRSGGSARSSAGKLGFNRMRETRQLPTVPQEKTFEVLQAEQQDSETGSIQEEGATFTRPVTEQELISALTDHAHKIAESILSQPDTGLDLVEDAKRAGDMWLAQNPANDISRRHSVDEDYQRAVESMASLRDAAKSADPTVAEYKDLLRETLASVMSSVHGSQQSIPAEADVDPALIDALAHEDIAPEDIEVTTDEEGKALIRARRSAAIQRELRGVKSGHTYRPAGGEGGDEVAPSIGLPRDADLGSLDVINYRADGGDSGDAGGAGKDESEHDSQKSSRRVSIKSGGSEKSRTSVKSKVSLRSKAPSTGAKDSQSKAHSKASEKPPSPMERRPSTIERRPSTLERRPSIIEKRPSTIEKRPSTIERRPSTIERQPSTKERTITSIEGKPSNIERKQSSIEKRPSTLEQKPSFTEKELSAAEKQSSIAYRKSSPTEKQPSIVQRNSSATEKQPSIAERKSSFTEKQPDNDEKETSTLSGGEVNAVASANKPEVVAVEKKKDDVERKVSDDIIAGPKVLPQVAPPEPPPAEISLSITEDDGGNNLEDDAASSKAGSSVKLEAASSAQSPTKSARSKKSIDDREEFVVGKVPDPKEIPALFGPIEEPPKPKEKKPRVPPAKPAKKAKGKKGTGKKAGKKEAAEAPTPQSERASESVAAAAAEPPAPNSKEGSVSHRSQLSGSPAPSEAKSEESMEFIIVRDEFSDEEPEVKSSRSVKSVKSVKSGTSSLGTMDTDDSHCKRHSQKSESEAEPEDGAVDLKAARAAKRAAQAEKRRLEVERKRREREEAVKKEKEEQERKEQLMRELEEDRRRKEEERRLAKEAKEQEKLRQEQLEQEKERKRQQELEREKRMKEEYQRKLEEMKRKQAEEDRIRKELEEQRQREAEEARLAEEAMLSQMAEAERIEYERRKREAEEEARRAEEALRKQREEEAAKAMEEAKRLAEEMARREEALRLRLQFNRAMQLESNGLAHSQEITRAFVFSYYELLKWLGIDVPEFERWKETMKF